MKDTIRTGTPGTNTELTKYSYEFGEVEKNCEINRLSATNNCRGMSRWITRELNSRYVPQVLKDSKKAIRKYYYLTLVAIELPS